MSNHAGKGPYEQTMHKVKVAGGDKKGARQGGGSSSGDLQSTAAKVALAQDAGATSGPMRVTDRSLKELDSYGKPNNGGKTYG